MTATGRRAGRHTPGATAEDRAAKLDALHAALIEQIAGLRSGQDWQRWLHVAARFHDYSFNNILLIAAQRPEATTVAGFQAWKALGRQVNKGERGIQILAPVVRRAAALGGADPAREHSGLNPDDPATVGTTAARRLAGFRVAHVFDVSQTSGPALPERPTPVLLTGQAPPGVWDTLAAQVGAHGFDLRRGPCLGGRANGLTDYTARTVTVRDDVDDAQADKTLAHELAHVLLHDPTARTTGIAPAAGAAPTPATTSAGQCRGTVEVEAESVAYLITASHGLDSADYTFPYVAGWASSVDAATPETVVRTTAQRVLGAAHQILTHAHPRTASQTQPVTARSHLQSLALAEHATHEPAEPPAGVHEAPAEASETRRAAHEIAHEVTPGRRPVPAVFGALPHAGQGALGEADGERLLHLNELAAAFFRTHLTKEPLSGRATSYLAARGISRPDAIAGGLGYAGCGWTELVTALRASGATDKEIELAGLAVRTSHGGLVDRFRDRLVLPIRNSHGRTIGFLGRALPSSGTDHSRHASPRYLNSPQTTLYRKSEVLYGLDDQACAALAAGAIPVLVEGPFDVRAINLAARPAAAARTAPAFVGVAPCGTSLTAGQIALLDASVGGLQQRGVLVAFDGDDAGRAAAVRAFWLLRAVDAWPLQVELAAQQDPAALLEASGPAAVLEALHGASHRPLADLVVDERLDRHADQLQWVEGTIAAARSAVAVVADLPVEQMGRQILRLVARLHLPAAEVSDMVIDAIFAPGRSQTASAAGPSRSAARTDQQPQQLAPPSELQAAPAAQHARVAFPQPLSPTVLRTAPPTDGAARTPASPPLPGVRRHA